MTLKQTAADFINNHSITHDGVISQTTLCNYFSILPPDLDNTGSLTDLLTVVNSFNLKKVSAYRAVNNIIRHAGLVMKQETLRDNSSITIQYRVQSKLETSHTIASYQKQAKSATTRAKELRAGVTLSTILPNITKPLPNKRGRPLKYPKIPGLED